MAEPFSIAILAGGRSRRMGMDKALARLDNRPLIVRLADALRPLSGDIFIAGGDAGAYEQLGLPHVADHFPAGAALAGVYTALAAARHRLCFVIACDLPFVPPAAVRALAGMAGEADAVVPRSRRGPEPLCAVYSKSCLAPVRRCIERGELSIQSLLGDIRTRLVDSGAMPAFAGEVDAFFNVNTPADLLEAERRLSAARAAARAAGPAPAADGAGRGAPLVCFVGRKDSGKTTFLEKLVPVLTARGSGIAYIKHDVHGLSLDREGTDTWRLSRAGARSVLISAPEGVAAFRRLEREPDLRTLCGLAGEADLIIAEGFKREPADRIEVTGGGRLVCRESDLIAVIGGPGAAASVPLFDREDVAGVAAFLTVRYGLAGSIRNRETGKEEE
jgi:molybdopterin-guanine dinucleotide biosynthesis protein B/molybdopterin-guanine dinucleotide biosynthesis protein